MTDKERLGEIEEAYRLSHKHIGAYVSSEGIEWLIEYAKEQVERVQDLKIMLKVLGKQNKRYREALEFYADSSSYGDINERGILKDKGQIARQALEGET